MASAKSRLSAALSLLLSLVNAQNPAQSSPNNPSLTTWKCTTSGGCVQQDTSVVIDWGYHWIHTVGGYDSCTTSSGVDQSLCPNEATCAANCVIDIVDYSTSGVRASGDTLTMNQYVREDDGTLRSASPRLYLLGADGNYAMLKLLGQELSFDVDVSALPCGENGALYLSQMSATGGRNQYNTGGAQYGSGYCDAQCPTSTWRNGTLNTNNQPFCCNEMDILEGNSRANSYTPHPCGASDCDRGGCGFNPYAQGLRNYWGPGMTVDTSKPFTITTQFITNDGTKSGTLIDIRRQYVQNGKLIPNAESSSGLDSITANWCASVDASAAQFGGLTTMGQALGAGMVLIFSIWNDAGGFMNWLDSGSNGPCSSTEGDPSQIIQRYPDTKVVFSNIRWGDIDSTYTAPGGSTTTTTSSAPQATQTHWGQCGGNGYTGPTACASPWTCKEQNPWYSQCL